MWSCHRLGIRLTAATLVVVFAMVSVTMLPAQIAGAAANDTVTNCNSSGPGSLPAVVAGAASGDFISFSSPCSLIVLSSTIKIATNLTIEGPGASDLAVSGNNAVQVFDVPSGITATISGISIEDGSSSQGGGIAINGTLGLNDVTVSGNNGSYIGGGIINNGSLTVTDSTVADNSAGEGGGGIMNYNGTLTLTGSTMSGNSGQYGGAIQNLNSLTITNSTISQNNSSAGGGAIYNQGGNASITDSTISNDTAGGDGGGGIYVNNGSVDVTNSTVTGNTGNPAAGTNAGGIVNVDGVVGVTDSTISGNSGGISNGAATGTGTVSVAATIVANSASGSDCYGTITDDGYNLDDDGTCGFTAGDNDLSDKPAGLDPSGLQNNGGSTETIALEPGSAAAHAVNSASLCSTPDQRGITRPTPCDIGAYQTASTVVTNCNDSGTGSLRQAIIDSASGDTVTFASALSCQTINLASPIDILANVTIDGSGAPNGIEVSQDSSESQDGNYGEVDFDIASGVTATLSGLTIDVNEDTGFGSGGIQNDGTLAVTDSTVANNQGPGFYNDGALTITNSTVSNDLGGPDSDGGGGIVNYQGTLIISNSTLSGNTATSGTHGGAIENDDGTVSIIGSTISDNVTASAEDGGGIDTQGGSLNVSNSTLSGNVGGAITDDGGTVGVSDSTFSGNSAGGGIQETDGTLTVANSTFWYNTEGSAISNLGGSAAVSSSTFLGNTGYKGAGGLYNASGSLSVAATIISNNGKVKSCSGTITDLGYNLSDNDTCGFSAANHSQSGVRPELGPLEDNGGPTQTVGLDPGSPAIAAVNSSSLCSTPDQRGVSRPTPCDIGAVQLTLPPQAITSPDSATETAGDFFSFAVTTEGTPIPSLVKTGGLPKGVKFVNNGNGTATISGTPKKPGVHHLTIRATFGKDMTKHVVTQTFTLTVDR
jgi:hypothetical protein